MPAGDRRQQILDAALAEFSGSGFAACKLDDIAKRAGIAKGTIYLHFRDKDDLFEQLVRSAAQPVLVKLADLAAVDDVSSADLIRRALAVFRQEVIGTARGDILRLVLNEGVRFPEIARFYHREVLGRGMEMVRAIVRRGIARGELLDEAYLRFPQLLIAPAIVALIWDGLFSPFDPLDIDGLLAEHGRIALRLPTGTPS